jgi:hypothetical protein
MGTVLGRIVASRQVHALIPGTCEYITLHGKENAYMDVQIGRLSWIIQMTQSNLELLVFLEFREILFFRQNKVQREIILLTFKWRKEA